VLREIEKDRVLRAIPVVISTSLHITPQLRERIPAGMYILSKTELSRERLSMVLHEATERLLAV
jgi:hypothetical protein